MFKSKQRIKTKIIAFLKKEHNEGQIKLFFKQFNLDLIMVANSRRYIHYDIVDKI